MPKPVLSREEEIEKIEQAIREGKLHKITAEEAEAALNRPLKLRKETKPRFLPSKSKSQVFIEI